MNPRETRARLQLLLDELVDALEAACIPVDSSTIEPGPPALDYCCGDGHAYVRVVRMHHTDPFPQQTLNPRTCDLTVGALVELGVLRCAPTLDAQGNAPHPAEITTTADQVLKDMSVVYDVLTAGTPPWANFPIVLDTWEPIGPVGGCVGGFWRAWVDVAVCPPQCPTSPTSPEGD